MKFLGLEMANNLLNKLCMDEEDPMLNSVVRCKHGILLKMQTSWSDRNPGRRFWSCPHYEPMKCNFFRWRDTERVDQRSRFIIPRLVNKIKELEENYEHVRVHLHELESLKMKYDNVDMNSLEPKEKIQLDEVESLTLQYDNLNISELIELQESNEGGELIELQDSNEGGELIELQDSKEEEDGLNEFEDTKEEKDDLNELEDSKENNLKEGYDRKKKSKGVGLIETYFGV
ncbi:uncharacterized protein LOC132062074 [Lycium ferocissimum]|uniref:uncharacterized protein LOC132062074 n=1 Tax=Lycium ferocissimum TaxID=112874 RepID=UPI0028159E24|nr:uncharacterized protein LOC132062074 [Lycium ferocissimum]